MALTNDERCWIEQRAGKEALEKIEEHENKLDNIPTTTVMDNIPSTEAADVAGVVEVINALLTALKAAGLMEADEETETNEAGE